MKTVLFLIALIPAAAFGGTIKLICPAGSGPKSAVAVMEREPRTRIDGKVDGDAVTFENVPTDVAFELSVTLKDGTVDQGIDLGWYSPVPEKKNAGPLDDDDRGQMDAIAKKVLSFYNVNDLILVKGTHNRAVALANLIRDKAFHADAGDEVIWRPELWYFENHHGGWEKVEQTDRVIRRERFKTSAEYHAVVDHLKWVPELGGIKPTKDHSDVTVTVPPATTPATTRPA